jgi:isocitrate dehydrogenase
MTKDLASLVGENQRYLTTEEFMDKLAENLDAALTGNSKEDKKLKAV